MRRRLYFILPDLETAQKVEQELLLAHIDDHHIHFPGDYGRQAWRVAQSHCVPTH